MGNCLPCKGEDPEEARAGDGPQIDVQQLSDVIHNRAEELTRMILESPLNNRRLPDFIERRLLEMMIVQTFTAIITILLNPECLRRRNERPAARRL